MVPKWKQHSRSTTFAARTLVTQEKLQGLCSNDTRNVCLMLLLYSTLLCLWIPRGGGCFRPGVCLKCRQHRLSGKSNIVLFISSFPVVHQYQS